MHNVMTARFPWVALALAVTGCTQEPREPSDDRAEAPRAEDHALHFGVVPAVSDAQTREIYGPLVGALEQAVGRRVELHIAQSYGGLLGDLVAGRAQLAQVSPALFATAAILRKRANKPVHLLAQERRGEDAQLAGVFVVPADSPAKSMGDLAGKRVLYVDDSSSSGYFYPRIRLRALGHDPDAFFGAQTFAGSHDAVVAGIKAGQADVGAVSERTAALSGLRIVERTEPIPDDALVSLEGLTAAERVQLTAFFLKAHDNSALTNFFIARGIERYVPAVLEVYEPQRLELERTPSAIYEPTGDHAQEP